METNQAAAYTLLIDETIYKIRKRSHSEENGVHKILSQDISNGCCYSGSSISPSVSLLPLLLLEHSSNRDSPGGEFVTPASAFRVELQKM
jgi:hypothetical protein